MDERMRRRRRTWLPVLSGARGDHRGEGRRECCLPSEISLRPYFYGITTQQQQPTSPEMTATAAEGFLVKIRQGARGKHEERYFILNADTKELNFYQQDTKG
jgi:hypothetical protein